MTDLDKKGELSVSLVEVKEQLYVKFELDQLESDDDVYILYSQLRDFVFEMESTLNEPHNLQ